MKTRLLLLVASMAAMAACVADSPVTETDAGPDGATGMDSGLTDSGVADGTGGGDTSPMADMQAAFDGNIYGNLELWLSSDVGVGQGDAGDVLTWTDRSVKARSVAMPGVNPCTASPTVTSAAIHGLPAVNFSGANECLEVSGAFADFSLGLTAFAVFQPGTCNSTFLGNSSALFDSYDKTAGFEESITIGRNPTPAQNGSGDGQLFINDPSGIQGSVQIVGGGSWVPAQTELLEFRLPAGAGTSLVAGTAFVNGALATLGTNDPVIPSFQSLRTTTRIGHS
ncbi:MAG: hypothetical protein ABIP89_17050, partial [Polyangiaceae bacterium]